MLAKAERMNTERRMYSEYGSVFRIRSSVFRIQNSEHRILIGILYSEF